MSEKRKTPPLTTNNGQSGGGGSLVKRARVDDDDGASNTLQVAVGSSDGGLSKGLVRTVKRTSSLQAPIVALTGAHTDEILDVVFSPGTGGFIAAASADKTISLWDTQRENTNVGTLSGHSKAVTCLAFTPSTPPALVSGSADGTVIVWDPRTGEKLRRLRRHRAIINSVTCTKSGRDIIASAADDGLVCLWDPMERDPLDIIETGYPTTAVEFSADASQLFVGGLDNDIHVYDLSRKQIVYSLRGHTEAIHSLSLSPSGSHLLSSAADSTLRIWDVRPFAPEPPPGHVGAPRLHRTLTGAPASGFDNTLIRARWSADAKRVATGGTDRCCTIFDVEQSKVLYKLPGHRGTCTAVALHPREPIGLAHRSHPPPLRERQRSLPNFVIFLAKSTEPSTTMMTFRSLHSFARISSTRISSQLPRTAYVSASQRSTVHGQVPMAPLHTSRTLNEQSNIPAGLDKIVSNPEARQAIDEMLDAMKKAGIDLKSGVPPTMTQMAKLAINSDVRAATAKVAKIIKDAGIELSEVISPEKLKEFTAQFAEKVEGKTGGKP